MLMFQYIDSPNWNFVCSDELPLRRKRCVQEMLKRRQRELFISWRSCVTLWVEGRLTLTCRVSTGSTSAARRLRVRSHRERDFFCSSLLFGAPLCQIGLCAAHTAYPASDPPPCHVLLLPESKWTIKQLNIAALMILKERLIAAPYLWHPPPQPPTLWECLKVPVVGHLFHPSLSHLSSVVIWCSYSISWRCHWWLSSALSRFVRYGSVLFFPLANTEWNVSLVSGPVLQDCVFLWGWASRYFNKTQQESPATLPAPSDAKALGLILIW